MKKLLIGLMALVGSYGVAFAATAGDDPKTITGTIGVTIGDVWGVKLDSYSIRAYFDTNGNADSTKDSWYSMGKAAEQNSLTPFTAGSGDDPFPTGVTLDANSLWFGSVDMSTNGIYSTLDGTADTTIDEPLDVGHRASARYMDTRIYVSNNKHKGFRVEVQIDGFGLLNTTNVPIPSQGGQTWDSVMHVATGALTPAMKAGATTTQAALDNNYLKHRVDVPACQILSTDTTPEAREAKRRTACSTKAGVSNGAAIVVYDSGSTTTAFSDAFDVWLAIDYLPIDVPSGAYAGGTVTWRLVNNA